MSSRDKPPASVVTSLSKSLTLLSLVEQWVQRGIVTGVLSVIPETVTSVGFFCHQKEWRSSPNSRPLVPQHFHFDSSVKNGSYFLHHPTPLTRDVGFFSRCDGRFSVCQAKPSYPKVFLFCLNGTIYMFLRLPFGLTTAPWAFS